MLARHFGVAVLISEVIVHVVRAVATVGSVARVYVLRSGRTVLSYQTIDLKKIEHFLRAWQRAISVAAVSTRIDGDRCNPDTQHKPHAAPAAPRGPLPTVADARGELL